jgi:hypothetical protein
MEKTPWRFPGALSAANLTALSCMAGPDVALVNRIRGYQRIRLQPDIDSRRSGGKPLPLSGQACRQAWDTRLAKYFRSIGFVTSSKAR